MGSDYLGIRIVNTGRIIRRKRVNLNLVFTKLKNTIKSLYLFEFQPYLKRISAQECLYFIFHFFFCFFFYLKYMLLSVLLRCNISEYLSSVFFSSLFLDIYYLLSSFIFFYNVYIW